ncbi:MAG: hypothetical protein IKV76_05975, partial [Clostridia bacterium]|nr:hypothetical protein [Clostridia bacterium]
RLAEDKELYVYSHCVGAAVAYKIISILERVYNVSPAHFVAGAYLPMKKAVKKNPWRFCPDAILSGILRNAGAVLPKEKEKDILKAFRADTDYSTEVFIKSNDKLSCPVSVVINKNDMFTRNYDNAAALWSRYSSEGVSVHFIESESHYFQSDNAEALFGIIKDILR